VIILSPKHMHKMTFGLSIYSKGPARIDPIVYPK